MTSGSAFFTVIFAVLLASVSLLAAPGAFADQPIGRIDSVTDTRDPSILAGPSGKRAAVAGTMLYERDSLQTFARQVTTITLVDGTVLVVGPSTRFVLKNWTGRDSDGHVVRIVQLFKGAIKAKVRKIYSQDEPFVISNRNGVVAVRGTEFVVEAGAFSQGLRYLTTRETATSDAEVEVHTLEGEVHFAKSLSDLQEPSLRVSVTAGQTSMVRETFVRPQTPHSFDLSKFKTYVAKLMPSVPVAVAKNTTNAGRAQLAVNSVGHNDTASPANPEYARADKHSEKTPTRSIASVESPTSTATLASENTSRTRLRGAQSPLTLTPTSQIAMGMTNQTTDGIRPALYGGDALNAASNYNAMQIAHQNTEAVQATLNGGQGMVIGTPPPVAVNNGPPVSTPITQPGVKIPSSFPPTKGNP